MPHGMTVSCSCYTVGFPVCYGSLSNVFAASSGFVRLYTLRFKEKEKRAAMLAKATVHKQRSGQLFKFAGRRIFSGLCKNFIILSPSEFEFLINLIGEKISKKDTAFSIVLYMLITILCLSTWDVREEYLTAVFL
jgi:hypothetical protein